MLHVIVIKDHGYQNDTTPVSLWSVEEWDKGKRKHIYIYMFFSLHVVVDSSALPTHRGGSWGKYWFSIKKRFFFRMPFKFYLNILSHDVVFQAWNMLLRLPDLEKRRGQNTGCLWTPSWRWTVLTSVHSWSQSFWTLVIFSVTVLTFGRVRNVRLSPFKSGLNVCEANVLPLHHLARNVISGPFVQPCSFDPKHPVYQLWPQNHRLCLCACLCSCSAQPPFNLLLARHNQLMNHNYFSK